MNILMKFCNQKILLICVVITLICASCQIKKSQNWSDFSLEQLCHFKIDRFELMNEDEVKTYITEKYGAFERSNQKIGSGLEEITIYRWKEGGTIGDAIVKDGVLIRTTIFNLENGPTLGEIVLNLGEPFTVYRHAIVYEKVLYDVGFDYVEKGISVNSKGSSSIRKLQHEGQLAVQLEKGMRIDMVNCYKPKTSIEEVLMESFFTSPQSTQIQLQRRSKWQGFEKWLPFE
jgi:hypothetical protein